jgi:hypothetical protein
MKGRHAAAFLALILFLLALAMALHRPPPPSPEPTFEGRTLTQIADLKPKEKRKTLRAIATNAIPCLLDWLSGGDKSSRLREAAGSVIPDTPGFQSVRTWVVSDSRALHFELAAHLFYVLGPDAAPAIPGLERLARDVRGHRSAYAAISVLGGIGPQALPALQRLAANPACPTRKEASDEGKRLMAQTGLRDSAPH